MADTAQVIFVNHTADHVPGDVVSVDIAEARRLYQAAMARPATEDEVARAAQQAEQESEGAVADADKKLADAKTHTKK